MPVVDISGAGDSYAFEGTFLDISDEAYKRVLQDLLPYGPAWTREPDRILTRLLCGLSREPSRTEFQARRLIEEADPRTTQELIDDWERFVGLPGDCENPPTDLEERRQAVVAKLRQRVSPTPAYFQSLAEGLGYTGVVVSRTHLLLLATVTTRYGAVRGPTHGAFKQTSLRTLMIRYVAWSLLSPRSTEQRCFILGLPPYETY